MNNCRNTCINENGVLVIEDMTLFFFLQPIIRAYCSEFITFKSRPAAAEVKERRLFVKEGRVYTRFSRAYCAFVAEAVLREGRMPELIELDRMALVTDDSGAYVRSDEETDRLTYELLKECNCSFEDFGLTMNDFRSEE